MNTVKLTLSVPKDVVAAAKAYSAATGQSVSKLVSRYLALLRYNLPKRRQDRLKGISPEIRRLTGILKPPPHGMTDDEALTAALEEKYHLR